MPEKLFDIGQVSPIDVFGVNDRKLKILQEYFPKCRVVARGTQLKVLGDDDDIQRFEEVLAGILRHFDKFNSLTEGHIRRIAEGTDDTHRAEHDSDVILHGNGGLLIKARTYNQRRMVAEMNDNDMLFAVGPAGTGKTYTAVALAVKALKNKEVRRIILTRPAVEAGENLGFLPGDLKEKLDPYLQPLFDALRDMLPAEKLLDYMENGVIQIAPLAFMRGRTLDKAYVILDEAQNATVSQTKMFLTRMGADARFIITGDPSQVDLPKHQKSGLIHALDTLNDIKGISIVRLDEKDVIRHQLVKRIIDAFGKREENESA